MTNEMLNAYGAPLTGQDALDKIRQLAQLHGICKTARELGIDKGSVSRIVKGDGAITGKRITAWLSRGLLACPVLGVVSRAACAAHAAFATTAASFGISNPVKLRLYSACRDCKGGCHAS